MEDAKKLVEMKIASKKVMIFSKSHCPYCTMTKDVFRQYLGRELTEDDYEVMEIEGRKDCDKIQQYFAKLTGAKTVPRVFIKGKCIGGNSDAQSAHSSGKLKQLLAK